MDELGRLREQLATANAAAAGSARTEQEKLLRRQARAAQQDLVAQQIARLQQQMLDQDQKSSGQDQKISSLEQEILALKIRENKLSERAVAQLILNNVRVY